jgi:hypothetical protein
MSEYSMDMSNEKEPIVRKLLPEGIREFQIVSCEEKTSKAGNQMFVVGLMDKETKYTTEVYLIATPGKRWALKQLLSACQCSGAEDGKYNWSKSDILEKWISAEVTHEDNKFINREGVEVESKQHRIGNFNVSNTTEWDA